MRNVVNICLLAIALSQPNLRLPVSNLPNHHRYNVAGTIYNSIHVSYGMRWINTLMCKDIFKDILI